jgi:hypothetical protein
MNKYLLKKILSFSLILLFIGAGINSVFASSITTIKEDIDKIKEKNFCSDDNYLINLFPINSRFRIFIFCEIEALTSGRAFLFPGYFNTLEDGINVSRASGFCIVGNTSIADPIKINGIDLYNWHRMIIVFYTGFLKNHYLNLPPEKQPIFTLDGNALLVIVTFRA